MKSEQNKEINVTWIEKKERRQVVEQCISDFRGGMTTGK